MWWRVIIGRFWQVTSPAWSLLYAAEFWAAAHLIAIARRWSSDRVSRAGQWWAGTAARRLRKLSGRVGG